MNKAQDYDDNHLPPTESDDESSRCMNTAPNVSMTATLPTIAQGQKPLTANEMLRMPRPTPWPAEGCRRAAPELLIPSPGRPRRVSVRPEGCRHMLPRDPSPPGPGRLGVRALGELAPAHSLYMALTDERGATAGRAPQTLQRNWTRTRPKAHAGCNHGLAPPRGSESATRDA